MISVEDHFYRAYPRLADGPARSASRPVIELLRHVTCETRINDVLASLVPLRGLAFVEQALEAMRFSYRVAPEERQNIPLEGRVVIVANHPLGAMDSLALLHLVGSVRSDVRILANSVLMQLAPLSDLLLPCDVFGSRTRAPGLREAYRALDREEALILFPSGEVSRMQPKGVADGRWSDGFVRIARRCQAPVLPVHVGARNSATFYGMSMLARPLATMLLPREMFAARNQRIAITVGEPLRKEALEQFSDAAAAAKAVKQHVYRLPTRKPPLLPTLPGIAHPESVAAVRRSLRAAQALGKTRDGKRILLLDAVPGCAALREIGRLRELAFRQVGEGTGGRRDLDRYDAHYRHLVLWDEEALEIVGAYRLAEAASIRREHGMAGLYTASLFDFSPRSDAFLDQGVELGRSFVQPRYWGSRSLDYLWQGIGAYLRSRPEVRYLFGPVSLSASLPERSRAWIVAVHAHYFGEDRSLAVARRPYVIPAVIAAEVAERLAEKSLAEGLGCLREVLAAEGASLPVLYRQYVDLCEPDGVRFLDFGVDPAFGHCVDGLVRIDLTRLKPAKRERYLGAIQQDVTGCQIPDTNLSYAAATVLN